MAFGKRCKPNFWRFKTTLRTSVKSTRGWRLRKTWPLTTSSSSNKRLRSWKSVLQWTFLTRKQTTLSLWSCKTRREVSLKVVVVHLEHHQCSKAASQLLKRLRLETCRIVSRITMVSSRSWAKTWVGWTLRGLKLHSARWKLWWLKESKGLRSKTLKCEWLKAS